MDSHCCGLFFKESLANRLFQIGEARGLPKLRTSFVLPSSGGDTMTVASVWLSMTSDVFPVYQCFDCLVIFGTESCKEWFDSCEDS